MARKPPVWVFVCGMYRTASTCQYQMVEDVVQMTESGIGIGAHTSGKLVDWEDYIAGGKYIVCKVFKYLPETSVHVNKFLREKRVRAIASIRDPRDIITSMKRRAGDRWAAKSKAETFHDLPGWVMDFMKWVSLGPQTIRVSRFEDFTINLPWEVREIARFLNIKLPAGMDTQIAERYTKEAQLTRAKILRESGRRDFEHPMLPHLPGIVFGTSGQWRDWLTPDEVKEIHRIAKSIMTRWEYL